MMRFQLQTFQVPRWLGPVLILVILALIPFALMLAAGLTVLAVGYSVIRFFLPPQGRPAFDPGPFKNTRKDFQGSDHSAIDADYEIKDGNEKGN